MNTSRQKSLALIASLLILEPIAFAQSTSKSEKSDDLVQLSAFTVKENADNGYIASESVTGTRVRTLIKDLPFAVSVITSEFMQDFDFFDLAKDMAYTANLNGVDTQGNSNLRGYGATFYLRNGFYRIGLVDPGCRARQSSQMDRHVASLLAMTSREVHCSHHPRRWALVQLSR